MLQDEIAWDQAQTEGNEIVAEYPTQNLDRREQACYNATKEISPKGKSDTPIYMSISANRPPKYEATLPTTDEVNYEDLEFKAFQLDV